MHPLPPPQKDGLLGLYADEVTFIQHELFTPALSKAWVLYKYWNVIMYIKIVWKRMTNKQLELLLSLLIANPFKSKVSSPPSVEEISWQRKGVTSQKGWKFQNTSFVLKPIP